jgi:hypothetical protein
MLYWSRLSDDLNRNWTSGFRTYDLIQQVNKKELKEKDEDGIDEGYSE